MKKDFSLAILIPVFNNLEYTKQCLKRLDESLSKELNFKPYVVIIDDGSTDGTSEWISEHYPGHIILSGNGSLWWSGGINKGMKHAVEDLQTDYILWWNNDILHFDGYFKNLGQLLCDNDISTVFGSKIYCGENKDIVWSMGGLFNVKSGKRFMIGFMQKDSAILSNIQEVDWLPGMGSVFHKSVIEKVGYVDEKNFPQYHGDSDYTLRVKENGFHIIVHPDLKIWNDIENSAPLHGGTFKGLQKSLTSIRSKYNLKKDILFFKRHAKGMGAYKFLFEEYFKYIGGFFKWKILNLLSIKKTI